MSFLSLIPVVGKIADQLIGGDKASPKSNPPVENNPASNLLQSSNQNGTVTIRKKDLVSLMDELNAILGNDGSSPDDNSVQKDDSNQQGGSSDFLTSMLGDAFSLFA